MGIGLRLSSQKNGRPEGSHLCTQPLVAAETDGRVLRRRCSPIDPDLLQRLGHIVRYEPARALKHVLAIRRRLSGGRGPILPFFRVLLGVLTERQALCG